MRRIDPPDGQAPEGWLEGWDSRPRLLPVWPQSEKLTVVAVRPVDDQATVTEGYVLDSIEELDAFSEKYPTALYFTVPRSAIERLDAADAEP